MSGGNDGRNARRMTGAADGSVDDAETRSVLRDSANAGSRTSGAGSIARSASAVLQDDMPQPVAGRVSPQQQELPPLAAQTPAAFTSKVAVTSMGIHAVSARRMVIVMVEEVYHRIASGVLKIC